MEELLKNVKKQKLLSIIELICFIICIMSAGIFIMLLIYKQYVYLLLCFVVFVIFAAALYFMKKSFSDHDLKYYVIELNHQISYENLKSKLEKNHLKSYSNHQNSAAFILEKKKVEYRIVLYLTEDFNKKQYYNMRKNVNRGLNKKYSIKNSDSIIKISSKRKMNIAFANSMNEELEKTLNIPADQSISLASPLLNVVIIENKLYIPYFAGYDLASIFSYDELVKEVFDLLEIEAE